MLNIAICDDDIQNLNHVAELINQYRVDRNKVLTYAAYQNPLELIAAVEKGMRYDVLLLDVVMPGLNGIEAAREIRRYDTSIKIIFLTNSSDCAVQSYEVGAYFYQLKPIWKESFFRLMEMVLSEQATAQAYSLILKCKTGIARIRLDWLEYCEVVGKTLFFHLANGTVMESVGSMEKLGEQLSSYGGFYRPHRSYWINLDYVQNISYHAITMTCLAEIPIPRGRYAPIKDAFLAHAFRKGWKND